jgi:uncharacterized membrane protein
MIDQILTALIFLAAIGSALIAGTFFAFSNFVMPALAKLTPASGIAAMQSINVVVLNPLFLGIFSGTAIVSLVLIVAAIMRWSDPNASYLLAGGMFYAIGSFAVTAALNVPLNNRLAVVDSTQASAADLWRHYVQRWTLWNHLRTLGSLAAFGCFIVAFP